MIIATKINIPRPKVKAVLRPRLLEVLQRNMERRLITIVAMAGAGKTTLLAQAVAQLGLPAVYFSPDESDSELAVFYEYLVTGLMRYLHSEERSTLSRTFTRELADLVENVKHQPDPEMASVGLINTLAEHRVRDLYFILDDFHVIPLESQVRRFLELFLNRLPQNIHLVIASRTSVDFVGLPQWAAKQEVLELTTSDLALLPEEAEAILSIGYGASLSSIDFKDLLERSQGWVTGLHLIMQAAGMHKSVKETINGYLAAEQPLLDYFAAEIYGRECDEVKKFLQRISILEFLEPGACDFLTQRGDSAERLADLEKRNTFVTRNESGVFSLHPLFKAFLQGSITDAKKLESWHRRATEYYAIKNNLPAVIDHAIAGKDFNLAARLMVSMYDQLRDATQFSRLARWLRELPQAVYAEWPRLLLAKARWLKEENDASGQQKALEEALSLLKRKRDRTGYCWALNELAGFRRQTNIDKALRLAQRTLRHCPPSDRLLRGELLNTKVCLQVNLGRYAKAEADLNRALKIISPDKPLYPWLKHNQAALHIYQGDNEKAVRLYQEITSRITKGNLEPETIAIFYAAFRSALESGDLAQAGEFIERGRSICHPLWNTTSQLIDAEADAFWLFYQGQEEKAIRMLHDIVKKYRELHNDNRALKVEVKTVRFCRLAGEVEAAETLLQSITSRTRGIDWQPMAVDKLELWFNSGMLMANRERRAEAIKTANKLLEYSKKINCHQGIFYQHLIGTKTAKQEEARIRHFLKTLECSRRYGYHGLLYLEIRADPELSQLIENIPDTKYCLGHIRRLLKTSGQTSERKGQIGIRARLLGTMELIDAAGKPIHIRWRTRRVKSLFAYLLINRKRFCHREELIDAIWPASPLDKAKKELCHTAFMLKKNLGDGFKTADLASKPFLEPVKKQSQSYRLNQDLEISLDIEDFERIRNIASQPHSDAEAEEMLKSGMEIYRDAFLPEISDLWCEKQRERFQGMFVFIAEKYSRLCQKMGKLEQALAAYQRILHDEPLADQIRIQYWKLLKESNRCSTIHCDYKTYVKTLKKEYGEIPPVELQAAYQALTQDHIPRGLSHT